MLTAACIAILLQQVASSFAFVWTWQIDESSFVQAWLQHDPSDSISMNVKPTPPPNLTDVSVFTPKLNGCFNIKGALETETEFGLHIWGSDFNASSCMDACLKKGRLYFALQNAGQCYCAREDMIDLKNLSRKRGKTCGDVCASEVGMRPTHWCGDDSKRAVYNIVGISRTYIGCYHDDKEQPDLPSVRPGSKFTIESCMQACVEYQYMALQSYGEKCFCGHSYGTDQSKHYHMPDNKCGDPCDENGHLCGEKYSNAVYSLGRRSLVNTDEVRAVQDWMPKVTIDTDATTPKVTIDSKQAVDEEAQTAPEGPEAIKASDVVAKIETEAKDSPIGGADTVSNDTRTAPTADNPPSPDAKMAPNSSQTANVEAKETQSVLEMMSKLDLNGDYIVTKEELSMAMMMLDAEKWTMVSIQLLVYTLDKNENDKLEYEEIAPWLGTAERLEDLGDATTMKKEKGIEAKQRMGAIFDQLLKFDSNSDQEITFKELQTGLQMDNPAEWDESNLKVLMGGCDKNSDGKLQYAEFLPWLLYHDKIKSFGHANLTKYLN